MYQKFATDYMKKNNSSYDDFSVTLTKQGTSTLAAYILTHKDTQENLWIRLI